MIAARSLKYGFILRRFASDKLLPAIEKRPEMAGNFAPRPKCYEFTVRRTFKNFAHEDEKVPFWEKIYCLALPVCVFFAFINYDVLWMIWEYSNRVQAEASNVTNADTESSLESDEDGLEVESDQDITKHKKKKVKDKIGFRDRKILLYENRIRTFATPDKTFRYFATVKVMLDQGSYEIYMTPDDLIRAITPNMKQPEGLGLDQFIKYDPKNVNMKLELALDEDSIFYKLGSSGLISFSDYIFLLTVLSTSRRHFEIAFRMFDLNGDGNVDSEEFDKVATLIQKQTSIGTRHRDHANTGNTFKGVNSALTNYFFGENKKGKLTIEKFLLFQEQLQKEILTLEFLRKDPDEDGKITEADFAELLLAYAGYAPKKKSRIIKRVKKTFKENATGISLDDYLKLFSFLNNINDVDTALSFYNISGASIDRETLKHVAKTVCHIELNDHVIDVVFTIFDENMDGHLSNREFIAVVKNRLLRGLEKPKDTGFVKFIQATVKCGADEIINFVRL